MAARLSLHVPEPTVRPGGRPDFSHVSVPEAGEVPRPPIDVDPGEIRDFAYTMIRVLDDKGEAIGDWAGALSAEELRKGLRDMMLTRAFDARMLLSQRQGKTSFYITSPRRGGGRLRPPQGARARRHVLSDLPPAGAAHRARLAAGRHDVRDFLQREGPAQGTPAARALLVQGGRILHRLRQSRHTISSGRRLGDGLGDRGRHKIASGWIGDGATAETDFHSALVFASVYRAPIILNIVNNQWAISSYQGIAGGESAKFAARAHGYGIASLRVDGNDYPAVYAVSKWAVERARANLGPTVIEWVTYRAGAHSTSDDPSKYRPKDEWAAWPLGDPVTRLKAHLVLHGQWSEERHKQMQAEVDAEVLEAAKEAESHGTLHDGPKPSTATMFEDVYKEMPRHLREQRQQLGV